jgi:hypothetical protein
MASHDSNIGLADSLMTQDFVHAVLVQGLHNHKFQSFVGEKALKISETMPRLKVLIHVLYKYY